MRYLKKKEDMRKLNLMLAMLLLCAASSVCAQYGFECTYVSQSSGYMEKAYRKEKKEIDPIMEKMLKAMSESKSVYRLVFSDGKVIFRKLEEGSVKNGLNYIYYDLATGTKVVQEECLGKTFIVEDTIAPIEWEIRNETRMIAGRLCTKAVKKGDTSENLVAWFSPETPLPIGPAGYGGLPGIIVQLDYMIESYVMQDDLKALEQAPALAPPDKGTKVTRAEMDEIRRAEMDEIKRSKRNNGAVPSGGFRIDFNNNN